MAERLVVDANVVAKLYLRDATEQYIDKTDLLFSRFKQGEVQLVAPRIITYEVPAAIKKGAVRVKAPKETWQAALSSLESLVESRGLLIIDDSNAKYEATRLAIDYFCTYYDALYLLLAQDLGCRFITDDRKLWERVHIRLGYLVLLASYR